MSQGIGLNPTKIVSSIVAEKPCYAALAERVAAIWKVICACISELFGWQQNLPLINQDDISQRCPDVFYNCMKYLLPEEVGRCETVCKAWKMPDKVWKAQCAQEKVSYPLKEGRHKEAFINPEPPFAFGVKEWKKYFGVDPGVAPRLPASIHRTIAQLKETFTLTLIPATIDGQPLCLNTFAPLAKKSGQTFSVWPEIEGKYGKETVDRSLWVWMQKEIEPETRSMTQAQAEQAYPKKLGKALWITVSIAAYYARYQITLFRTGTDYTRTCDTGVGMEDLSFVWSASVGGRFSESFGVIASSSDADEESTGVAYTFPVTSGLGFTKSRA